MPDIEALLLAEREKQKEYREVCGNCYNRAYSGYICVDELGNMVKPDYVSRGFKRLLEKKGLRHIRFHDLRHSCASLLAANKVDMRRIQDWMGHSDITTTSRLYVHLQYSDKEEAAGLISDSLSVDKEKQGEKEKEAV